MRAWRVHRHGAPSEVLRLDEIDPLEPGPGQVRVAVTHAVTSSSPAEVRLSIRTSSVDATSSRSDSTARSKGC